MNAEVPNATSEHPIGVDVPETKQGMIDAVEAAAVRDEQQTAESLGEVATQIPVVDGSEVDTRQDPIKAETVGRTAMEDEEQRVKEARSRGDVWTNDIFDDTHVADLHRRMTEPSEDDIKSFDDNARDLAGFVADSERGIEEATQDGDLELANEYRQTLKANQRSYEEALSKGAEKVKEEGRYQYESFVPQRKEAIEAKLQLFEELYDLNPELFAKMPTEEFIATYRELSKIERAVSEQERVLSDWMRVEERIATSIEDKKPIHMNMYDNGYSYIGDLFTDKGVADEMSERFRKAFEENRFDRSPRQIAEEVHQILTELVAQAKKLLDEAERAKQEFMAKYAKNQESEAQSQETAEAAV